ncbi:hypothetical protein [Leifsonia sp. Root112D2]|uniref:hypothetical protein n=1 Tax=Leifsonia sp. Root112D2 TaxID=1736426 RepID=UPI001910913D|nr:hypothetical protein [Leifsonia sp. Root112D2]
MSSEIPARRHGRHAAVAAPAPSTPQARSSFRHNIAVGVTALALVAGLFIAPAERAEALPSNATAHLADQEFAVGGAVRAEPVSRDSVSATDGVQTLSSNGTNADWAKLVLMYGGWPQSEQNVTVILRWMRQENGTNNWWNRNNPLNNGYGSGGGAGLGSYPDLATAADYAAANLVRGYPAIVAGLASSASADATARAIWASPWSTSHYANGSHWSSAPVDIVKAPASAW